MPWSRSDGPIKVPVGTLLRIVSLAHGERRLGTAAIAAEVNLPVGAVGAFLKDYNRRRDRFEAGCRRSARLAARADQARLPRPLYVRDAQDNPVPNPRLRGERNPLASGAAAHTLADNRVDRDYLDTLRHGGPRYAPLDDD